MILIIKNMEVVFIKINKFISILFIFLILNSILIFNSVKATNSNSVSSNIISNGSCQNLIMYKGSYITTDYTFFEKDGVKYPAYNLEKNGQTIKQGVKYPVSAISAINDVQLWRILVNGFPYKVPSELGCVNDEEAFTATKQAVYCYMHSYDKDYYSGIGESGSRIVNAIKLILAKAESSKETPISNGIKIVKENEKFSVDNKEKEYISKLYSVSGNASISNYTVGLGNLSDDSTPLPDGIKITDESNNVKNEFKPTEKFKVLIPIKRLTDENTFKIEVSTKINSKPVFYGKILNSDQSSQDYILTSSAYEDTKGDTTDKYFKNETKLKIIKQDDATKARLAGVKFNVLDGNKNAIYANLVTNEQGEILVSNLLPCKYYIQETEAKEGYVLSNNLFEINLELNEECTVTVDNSFKEETTYNSTTKKNAESYSNTAQRLSGKQNKKLPVTGM